VANVRIISTYADSSEFHNNLWIDVVVEETVQGTIEYDTMTILASQGTSCDPGFSEFRMGENLIVQVGEEYPNGPTDWYTFVFNNGCEESYLSLKDGSVTGFIRDKYEMQSYSGFKNNIGDCANFTHILEKEDIEGFVFLFPVPAASGAFIETLINIDYELTIYSASGQKLLHESVTNETRHPLDVAGLPNGLYFVRITVGEVTIVQRLLVQR